MMEILNNILDFLQKNFTGKRILKIKSRKIAAVPKVARLFIIGFLTTFIGDQDYVQEITPIITYLGYSILFISIFCMIMLRIFKRRQFNGLTAIK